MGDLTDKELLLLAAKAAGIEIKWRSPYVAIGDFVQFPHNAATDDLWNPLTDDGDALRLAVKLNLQVTFDYLEEGAVVKVSIPYDQHDQPEFNSDYYWIELLSDSPYAATRLAIVLASASIGQDMK